MMKMMMMCHTHHATDEDEDEDEVSHTISTLTDDILLCVFTQTVSSRVFGGLHIFELGNKLFLLKQFHILKKKKQNKKRLNIK